MIKTIRYFGYTTTTGIVNVNWPDNLEGSLMSEYAKMDVICNVLTLAGTNPVVTFYVKEQFPLGTGTGVGTTYVITGQTSGAISTTGMYVITHDTSNATNNYASPSTKDNPLMGKGGKKMITAHSTPTGTFVTAFYADFAIVFYN